MIPCSVSNAGLNSDNNSLTSDSLTGIDGTFCGADLSIHSMLSSDIASPRRAAVGSLTDARVCNASALFWSVSRARSINHLQVFSAVGSKLSKPRVRRQPFHVWSSLPEVVRWIQLYLNHADQHFDNRSFDVGVRIRVQPCRAFFSLVLSGQRGLVMPEREARVLVAQLGQVQARRVRGCR